MLICHIKENSLRARLAARKLGMPNMAVTMGRTIYLYKATREEFLCNHSWVCHEICHVQQFSKYGLIRFLCLYAWETGKHGYRRNKFELEAMAAEKDEQLLRQVLFPDC